MEEIDAKKYALKNEFIKNRGYWADFWAQVLDLDADFFAAYSKLSSVPAKTGHLTPKVREFLYIAIDASTTHLYRPGLRLHIKNALNCGATQEEVMEVLELTSVLGIHTCTLGVPLLIEELRDMGRGHEFDVIELNEREKKLKEQFIGNRGYWNELWDSLLKLSPEFFEAYLEFSSVPWQSGPLPPKIKEFIYIAIDTATTHLYQEGARQHIRNALELGATKEEIMEVLQCTSVLGVHSTVEGVPILIEEIDKASKK